MSKFNITKKISLAEPLGEGHESDYLRFKPLTFKDAKTLQKLQPKVPKLNIPDDAAEDEVARLTEEHEAAKAAADEQALDKAVEFVTSKFVTGMVTDEDTKEQVKVEASDVEALGVDVINYCMEQMAGGKPEGFIRR